tara:strand:- start:2630 stop:3421 length:792 start_codon:yes stop_codon:yes gene_type:complete
MKSISMKRTALSSTFAYQWLVESSWIFIVQTGQERSSESSVGRGVINDHKKNNLQQNGGIRSGFKHTGFKTNANASGNGNGATVTSGTTVTSGRSPLRSSANNTGSGPGKPSPSSNSPSLSRKMNPNGINGNPNASNTTPSRNINPATGNINNNINTSIHNINNNITAQGGPPEQQQRPLSPAGSVDSLASLAEFAEPHQTIMLFDWDDTLCPSTFCRNWLPDDLVCRCWRETCQHGNKNKNAAGNAAVPKKQKEKKEDDGNI